ncbi:MAG TPA: hypothetical protein VGE10_01755 [Zeimonas sp.]
MFAALFGTAVVLGGAWWLMTRKANAATAAGQTFSDEYWKASDAFFDQWYYAGKPLALDARDTWASSVGLTPADVNGTSQAELLRTNPFLLNAI